MLRSNQLSYITRAGNYSEIRCYEQRSRPLKLLVRPYAFLKTAWRLLMKASMPSFWSAVANMA